MSFTGITPMANLSRLEDSKTPPPPLSLVPAVWSGLSSDVVDDSNVKERAVLIPITSDI